MNLLLLFFSFLASGDKLLAMAGSQVEAASKWFCVRTSCDIGKYNQLNKLHMVNQENVNRFCSCTFTICRNNYFPFNITWGPNITKSNTVSPLLNWPPSSIKDFHHSPIIKFWRGLILKKYSSQILYCDSYIVAWVDYWAWPSQMLIMCIVEGLG